MYYSWNRVNQDRSYGDCGDAPWEPWRIPNTVSPVITCQQIDEANRETRFDELIAK